MGSTSNIQLETIAQFYNINLTDVVQKDLLNDCRPINNSFYIINNASSYDSNGSHWVCLYLNANQSFFFDSFGAYPSMEIVDFVKKYSKHLNYSTAIIQNINSNNCGYYAIGWALYMTHNNYNHFGFIKQFRQDTRKNDLVLEGIIRSFLPENKKIPKILTKFFNMNYR